MVLKTEHITEQSLFWNAVNTLAKEAFPVEEYLDPAEIVRMAQHDSYDFLALLDEDQFVGFMVVKLYKKMTYLFFLAIDPNCRAKGYGSRAIETLKANYPDRTHTVDLEMLDENAQNYLQRIKRKRFYLRNGYVETGLFLSYLGVDYEVLYIGTDFVVDDFKEMMQSIQIKDFAPRYFTK